MVTDCLVQRTAQFPIPKCDILRIPDVVLGTGRSHEATRTHHTLLGCAAVVWSFAAHGQSPKPVIGFLRNTTPDESAYLLTALRKGLNETGYVEGENLVIEYRWGGGHQDQLRGLADDLIRHNVSLIIGGGDAAIIAARAATTMLPMVFVTGDDPVKLGY